MSNGYYGCLQGPFLANEELLTKIQADCNNVINYISKIGIHYSENFNLDINGNFFPQIFVILNGKQFQIGKTGSLDFEDVQITSVQFKQNVSNNVVIHYQYK